MKISLIKRIMSFPVAAVQPFHMSYPFRSAIDQTDEKIRSDRKKNDGSDSAGSLICPISVPVLKSPEELFLETYARKYKIEELIGEGSVSLVYRATHLEDNVRVAIKINKHISGFVALLEEFRLSLKLSSVPYLPKFYQVLGNSKDKMAIVCEYLGKRNLSQKYLVPESYRPSSDDLRSIVRQLLEILKAFKEKSFVHADLKPENLFYNEVTKELKIIDFSHSFEGTIKLEGNLVQTITHRAPEVFLNKKIDYKIDMWSLGCIIYELVTAGCLFKTRSVEEKKEIYYEFIRLNVALLGNPSIDFSEEGSLTDHFFKKEEERLVLKNLFSFPELMKTPLERKADCVKLLNHALDLYYSHLSDAESESLVKLIFSMVKLEGRISPEDALKCSFLKYYTH